MANAGNYTDTTDTDFRGTSYNIDAGKSLAAEGMRNALHTKEKATNKQTYSTDAAGTLTASSSDSYYPTSKLVGANLDTLRTALNGKQNTITAGTANNIVAYSGTAGTLNTLTRQVTVRAAASALDTALPTEKAVANAISTATSTLNTALGNKQNILPIGTILMYDGSGWVDNSTMPGWYACIAANAGRGCPNLVDRFIKGSSSSGATGGSNALTAAMLPKHTHSIYTNATKNTARTASKNLTGNFWVRTAYSDGNGVFSSQTQYINGWEDGDNRDDEGGGIFMDATHEHTGGASSDNSSTGDSNTSNMPAYYAVIYIKRCA